MTTIALHQISGISPFNARRSPPSDEEIEELAASIIARGVMTPLLLRVENKRCMALDGGRRFFALRRLADRGEIDVNFPVPHTMFSGSDEEAAEASLISFVQRRDLHPVDEFERFAELRDRFGLDAERIAKATGKSLRFVKERLRLSRLAPKVREAWRAGRIVAELAHAFSASESHEEQERVFAEYVEDYFGDADTHIDPEDIRSELRGEAVRATDRTAIFVGADAYAVAGGALDEQLFEKDTWFLDAPLLRRLAQEKMETIGREIVEREGWGWVCYDHKDYERWAESKEPFEADYTEAEDDRLDAIEAALEQIADVKERDRLEDERDAIEARAMLRAISADERGALGVYVSLDLKGRVSIARGLLFEPKPREASETSGSSDGRSAGAASRPHSDSASRVSESGDAARSIPAAEPIGKPLRAVLDEATNAALSDAIGRNVSLALVIAVASLGCSWGVTATNLRSNVRIGFEPKSELLKAIEDERFEAALTRCAKLAVDDPASIPVAFAELVGAVLDVAKAGAFDPPLQLLSVASRFGDIGGALDAALDREAFFKANPRDVAIEAIRAIEGDAAASEANRLKKAELVQRAALLAKDRHWLPQLFTSAIDAAPRDERTTAEAMLQAIEADEAREAESGDAVEMGENRAGSGVADEAHAAALAARASAPENDAAGGEGEGDAGGAEGGEEAACSSASNRVHVANFLATACRRAEQAGRIKASELAAAFDEFARGRGWPSLGRNHLAQALAENGVEKTRLKNGVHYLGLALRAAEAPQVERLAAE